MSTLVIGTANAAGQRRVPLGEVFAATPDVIVVCEARRARFTLIRQAMRHGYKARQFGPHRGFEAAGIAVLVRRRHRILSRRLLSMSKRWRGPFQGRWKRPRQYPLLVLDVRGEEWGLFGAHFPSGGPGHPLNAPAWIESAAAAAEAQTASRYVVTGDLNALAREVKAWFPQPWVFIRGGKVDHTVALGATGESRRLNQPKGMHGFFVYTLRADA